MYKIINEMTISIGSRQILFPCSISGIRRGNPSIVVFNELVIVNFYPFTEEEDNNLDGIDMERNIWAFNTNGDLVWKIQPPTIRPYKSNAYSSVYIKDGFVLAGNSGGFDYKVDTKNGDVTKYPDIPTRPW